jgi:GDP-mannose 6-dehydrogenase
MVELAERLIGKGFHVRIYDDNVTLSRLMGANRAYIEERVPHIGELLSADIEEVTALSDVYVVGSNEPAVAAVVDKLDEDRMVLDLVRLPEASRLRRRSGYRGIGW